MINMVIAFWSISLLQFSVTIQKVETIAQEKDIEGVKLEKLKENEKNEPTMEIKIGKRSNRVAPALYTYKLAQRKAMERQKERRSTMDLHSLHPGGVENNLDAQSGAKSEANLGTKTRISRLLGALKKFEETVQKCIHTYIDVIQLLTPMLFQDGPFLIIRLFVLSKYDTSESNMFLFLIAKNALVVMLQVYRICVLYCKPSNREGTDDDIFHEHEAVRLRNVQTAHASMHTATVTVEAASRFKARRERKLKRSRTSSLSFMNSLAGLRERMQNSRISLKGGNSKRRPSDGQCSVGNKSI